MAFSMDDYVDVAERIRGFYEQFPDGSLRCGTPPHVIEVAGKPFIVYHAQAFRHPEDTIPADGWAWEPVPGPTPYTKDSELMNAETAAWGRAIVALGFSTKKIASAQEVRARQPTKPEAAVPKKTPNATRTSNTPPATTSTVSTDAAEKRLYELVAEFGAELEAVRVKVEKHRYQSDFPGWLAAAITKMETSIKNRKADADAAKQFPIPESARQ